MFRGTMVSVAGNMSRVYVATVTGNQEKHNGMLQQSGFDNTLYVAGFEAIKYRQPF